MPEDTIFSRIVRGEIPADIVHQDDLVTAFRDIQPLAPTHILIVPNRAIPTLADVSADDEAVLGRMLRVAADLAADEGVARKRLPCHDQLPGSRRAGDLPPSSASAGRAAARPNVDAVAETGPVHPTCGPTTSTTRRALSRAPSASARE